MEVIMFRWKLFFLIALFGLINNYCCAYNYTEIRSLFPFGKTNQEISSAIKELATKKIPISDAIHEHFEMQQQQIMAEIKSKNNIPDAQWKEFEKTYQSIIANDPLYKTNVASKQTDFEQDPVIKKVREVIAQCGLNPDAVSILYTSTHGTNVESIMLSNNVPRHTLFVNLFQLKRLNYDEIIAVLKHEAMHLKYADSLRMALLEQSFPYVFHLDTIRLNDHRKNFELRADILSIGSQKEAESLSSFFSKNKAADSEHKDEVHPTIVDRIDAIKQLQHYMKEEEQYKTSIVKTDTP